MNIVAISVGMYVGKGLTNKSELCYYHIVPFFCLIGAMVKVTALEARNQCSIPSRVIPKTSKY